MSYSSQSNTSYLKGNVPLYNIFKNDGDLRISFTPEPKEKQQTLCPQF